MKSQNNVHHSSLMNLPPEIIEEEILSRLPVKSLLRFRCVKKSWRSLIDSDQFIKNHHQNSRKNQSFPHQRLILHQEFHPHEQQCSLQSLFNDSFVEDPSPLENPIDFKWESTNGITGSQNGLLCVRRGLSDYITLCNPSTRISNTLPIVSNHETFRMTNIGFGWIESSNEYKVFVVVSHPGEVQGKPVAMVYSSKTKLWKTLLQQWDLPITSRRAEYIGEKAYWSVSNRRRNVFGIVTFDFKSEVFGMIRMPFPRPDTSLFRHRWFRVTEGWVCVSLLDFQGNCDQVWVMMEHGEKDFSWERVPSFSDVVRLLERPFSAPFTVGANGEIFLVYGSTFWLYYPRDDLLRRSKIVDNFYGGDLYVESVYGDLYVESLISPVFS